MKKAARYLASMVLLGFLVVGCGTQNADNNATGISSQSGATVVGTTSGVGQHSGATTGAVKETAKSEQGVQETPFTSSPEKSGGSKNSADKILAVRFGGHVGFERVVIDLGTGTKAASQVPQWRLTSPTGDGYVRITFPSVASTGVSDGAFGGNILDRFYVVRAPDNGVFVDLFASGAFQYRVMELSDPARLVVDLKPVNTSLDYPPPARAGKTVLMQPRKNARISSPLTVSGYSRNFEGSNTVILKDANGKVLARKVVQGNDWSGTWGYFETTLGFPAFKGEGTLQVGAESPRDGSFEGVQVPVTGG